jgi:hypothetical protein
MWRVAALALLVLTLGIGHASALLVIASVSPGNALATGAGTWFSGTASGSAICAGANATLACPFGTQSGIGKVTAQIALQNKGIACTYTLTVVDGSGPVGISTLLTATFASTASGASALVAGAADTIDLVLKLKGSTPAGTYSGTLVLADSVSGLSVAIPLSFVR